MISMYIADNLSYSFLRRSRSSLKKQKDKSRVQASLHPKEKGVPTRICHLMKLLERYKVKWTLEQFP